MCFSCDKERNIEQVNVGNVVLLYGQHNYLPKYILCLVLSHFGTIAVVKLEEQN